MVSRLLVDALLALKLLESFNLPIKFSKSMYFNQPLNMLILYYTPTAGDKEKEKKFLIEDVITTIFNIFSEPPYSLHSNFFESF